MKMRSFLILGLIIFSSFIIIYRPNFATLIQDLSKNLTKDSTMDIINITNPIIRAPDKPDNIYFESKDELWGDLNVKGTYTIDYTDLVIYGNITIWPGGTLIIRASTVRMAYHRPIYVYNGGNLTVISSTITDYNASDDLFYWIVAEPGAFIKIVDSIIEYAGYQSFGSGVQKRYALNITGATFELIRATFSDNNYGLYITNCLSGTIDELTIRDTHIGEGLRISNSQNIDITDSTFIRNAGAGLKIEGSTGIDITNIEASSNDIGVYISSSTVNLVNVKAENNAAEGIYASSSTVTIQSVTLRDNGKDLKISSSQGSASYLDINTTAQTAILIMDITTSFQIEYATITMQSYSSYGIWISDSNSISLYRVTISGKCSEAIHAADSTDITIKDARISDVGGRGIYFNNVNDSMVSDSGITNSNSDGIVLEDSDNVTIYHNSFAYSDGAAIYATSSTSLNITMNVFYSNSYGVYFTDTVFSSVVYNNDFIDNHERQAYDAGANSFDNSTHGNYWSDYPNNSTYIIDSDSIDYHPRSETLDQNPPTITITVPINGSSFSTSKVHFEWTASDDFGIRDFQYSLDGNEWISLGYTFSANITIPDGYSITVYIRARDWSGNYANDSVVIDVQAPPSVEILSPGSGALIPKFPFNVKIRVSDNSIVDNFSIYWNDTHFVTDHPADVKDGTFIISISVPDGYIILKVIAYDSYGNSGYTTVDVYVEAPPKVTILTPHDNDIFNTSTIYVEWDARDNTGIWKSEVYVNGLPMNVTYGETFNTTITIGEGRHNITVIVYDHIGKTAMDIVYFMEIDVTPPSINIITPTNGTTVRNSTVTFEWELSDNTGLSYVAYSLVQSLSETGDIQVLPIRSKYSLTFENLPDGTHYLKIYVKDLAGNSKVYNIRVNVQEPPKLEILFPQNHSVVFDWDVLLTWKGHDNSKIIEYKIKYLENEKTIYVTDSEQDKTWQLSLESLYGNPLDDGDFVVYIDAKDESGNIATYKVYFTIAMAPKFTKIGVYHPLLSQIGSEYVEINNTYISASTIKFRLLVADNEMNPIAVWARIDENEWKLLQNSTNYEVYVEFKNVNEGKHYFWFKASDGKNERIVSVVLIVDFTPPKIIAETPVIYSNTGNITVRWYAQDNVGIYRYEVYVNGTGFRFLPNGTRQISMTLPTGAWEIEIRAVDPAGNSRSVTAVAFVDKTPPKVSIISPTENQIVPVGIYEIKWNMSDNVEIDHVEIYLDWELIVVLRGNETSYKVKLAEGAHTLLIKVYDKASNPSYDYVSFGARSILGITASSLAILLGALTIGFVSFLAWRWGKAPKKRGITEGIREVQEIEGVSEETEAEGTLENESEIPGASTSGDAENPDIE